MGELVTSTLEAEETIIERGLATFMEVGEALGRIRDQRLYKQTHSSFDAYCRARWGFGRNYGDKQIRAAREVVLELGTGVPIPQTEGEARRLRELRERVAAEREYTTEELNARAADPNREWKWAGLSSPEKPPDDRVIVSTDTELDRDRLMAEFGIKIEGEKVLSDGRRVVVRLDLPRTVKAKVVKVVRPDAG